MTNIRNLFSRNLLAAFRQQRAGTIIRRKLKVERLEDRTNPAPIPSLSNVPGAGTIRSFIGEGTSFTVSYTNTGDQTGYSPFLDLGVDVTGADGAGAAVDDGITATPTITGVGGALTLVGTINLTGAATYNNPFTGENNITVPAGLGAGDRIYVYRLPFGSITPGQTTGLTVNLQTSNLADLNTAIPVSLRPAFRDGNLATGGTPISGSVANTNVTPQLFTLTKVYLGPEDETATGPNFRRRYRVDIDIATGQTIANLQLTDILANSMQYTGAGNVVMRVAGTPITTNVTGTTATTLTPGGNIVGNFGSVTGIAGNDASLEFEFYVPRDNSTGAEILPQPTPPAPNPAGGTDRVTANNTGSVSGSWTPIDTPRDPVTPVSQSLPANAHVLEEQSIAVQKTVTPVNTSNVPTGGTITPGATLLRYDIDFQVSDYYAMNGIFLNDILGDGQRLYVAPGFTPTLTVNNPYTYAAGGTRAATSTGAFTGAGTIGFSRNYTIRGTTDSDPTTYAGDVPTGSIYTNAGPGAVTGGTGLTFNISNELIARGLPGILVGGEIANGGGNPQNLATPPFGGATGRITFWVEVKREFSDNFPSGDRSVDQGDTITNAVPLIQGNHLSPLDLVDGTPTLLGTLGTDDTGTSVGIPRGTRSKDLVAVNGVTTNLSSPNVVVQPGDRVTYRLQYSLPISSFENLSFVDFPPLPVFPVPNASLFTLNASTSPTYSPYEIAFGASENAGGTPGYFETFAQNIQTVNVATTGALAGVTFNPTGGAAGNGSYSSAPANVDGVALVIGNRVLVKDQLNAAQNGVFRVVGAGIWERDPSFDTVLEAQGGAILRVAAGTVNSGGTFVQDNQDFNAFNGAGATGNLVYSPFITTDPTTNSIRFNFGSFDDPARRPTTIDLLITLPVADAPFVSDLNLTNQFVVQEGSTNNGTQDLEAIRLFELVRPTENIFKGVVGFNGTGLTLGGIAFTAPTAVSNFTGTVANATQGGAIGASNTTGRDAGDEIRYAVVVQNSGRGDGFDNVFNDTIQPEYTAPTSLATFLTDSQTVLRRGDGTALTDGRAVNQIVRAASVADAGGSVAGATITGANRTFDGLSLNVGDLVLLKDQTTASQNGVYQVTALSGANADTVTLVLAINFNGSPAANGLAVAVLGGTVNADRRFSAPTATPTAFVADAAPTTATFYYAYNPTTRQFQINLPDVYTAGNTNDPTFDNRTGGLSRGAAGTAAAPTAISNGSNSVVMTYDLTLTNRATPNQTILNTATLTNYGASQGGTDFTNVGGATDPTDTATVTVPAASVGKLLTGTSLTNPGNNAATQAVIGEILTYTVTVTMPEATAFNAQLVDSLDAGLAFVDVTNVTSSSGLTFAGGLPSVSTTPANTTVTGSGQTITFNLGDIVNADTNNAAAETFTITYRAVVLNTAANRAGQQRNNAAVFQWAPTSGGTRTQSSNTGSAANAVIVEPTVATTKQVRNVTQGGAFSGTTGADNNDIVEYRVQLRNNNAASDTTAYDVTLNDPLPPTTLFQPTGQLAIQSITAAGGGTLSVTGGTLASAFSIVGNTLILNPGFNIDMAPDTTITIVLQGTYTGSTGQVIPNTATAQWSSLDGTPGQISTYNAASTERTGADGLPGAGILNDYRSAGTANIDSPPLVRKTVVSTSETGTTGSNTAVGEIVRYRMYVSLGEGTTNNFQIEDRLPPGLRFVNDGTARFSFLSTGGNSITSTGVTNVTGLGTPAVGAGATDGSNAVLVALTSAQVNGVFNDNNVSPNAAGTGTGDVYASGDDIFFRFGNLVNTDNDNDNEYVVVEFNALVENVAGNQNGTVLNNNFGVRADTDNNGTSGYINVTQDNGDGVGGAGDTTVNANDPSNNGSGTPALSANAPVTVVEPVLTIAKTIRNETNNPGGAFAENVPADAGDLVTFQATFTNTGTSPAYDITLADVLPAGVTLNGVVSQTGGPALTTLAVVGNAINGTFTDPAGLAVGQSITIQYQGVAGTSVTPNQTVTNTATATWTSLPGTGTTGNPTGSNTPGASGTATGERDASGGVNDYTASDTASFTVPAGQYAKTLFGSSIPGTTGSNVAVGETVQYALRVTLPEGTTNGLVLSDLLPTNLTYTGFTLVTTAAASNGVLASDFNGTVPAPTVSGGPFVGGTDPVFTFGAVTTTGDNTAGNNSFLVIVNAVVRNVVANEGILPGQTGIPNTATMTVPGQALITTPPVNVTVVEPQLTIDKRNVGGATVYDAGQNVPFELVVSHTAASTGPAFDLLIADAIPAGLQMVAGSAFVFNQPGYTATTITQNGPALQISASELRPGDTITIRYLATVQASVAPGGSITNTATVNGDTTPGTNPEERTLPQASDTQTITLFSNSIAGVIWNDANNDGVYQSATETLITAPVRIQLTGTDNLGNAVSVLQSTVNGAYNFTGLRPGTYTLTELDQPAGFLDGRDTAGTSSPGTPFGGLGTGASAPRAPRDAETISNVVIGSNGNKAGVNYNFGEIVAGSIGDFVWEDTNGNGRQDGGEPGLVGVTVNLNGFDDSGNAVNLTTTTVAGGAYNFGNLRPSGPGGYVVTFLTPTGYSRTIQNSALATTATDSDGSVGTGQTAPIALGVGQNITNVDQGMYRPVALGNQVWVDTDANGVQNGGEPGIPNVQMQLFYAGPDGVFDAADLIAPVATTTTNTNGQYQFGNLIPGLYRVVVNTATLPNGLTTQTYDRNGLGTPNSDTNTLVSGADDFGFDFGYRGSSVNGSLGDTVWLDQNANGTQDAGEPGLPGITVNATWLGFDGVAGGGDDINYSTVTDANGRYIFTNLASGNYTVTVVAATLPLNLVPTFDPDGTGTANTTTTALTLTAGVVQNRTDVDFGYRGQASLGDTVFYDVDGDGVQGNSAATGFEPGIAGVTVTATFAGRDGDLATTADNLTFTTVTDANGRYLFTGIPGGNSVGTNPNYRVTVTQPAGYAVPSADPDGLATANTAVLQLGAAENNTAQDFGYRGPATQGLGNFVWDDTNGNGVQDTGEPGIVGATVELLNAAGVVLDRTTTGTGGIYSFPNLADSATFGQYRVRFTAPTGFVFTTQSSPQSTTANDSNADATTGVTGLVTLAANTTDNSIDAGFYQPVTLGNRVYFDANGDGIQQAGEPGIPGTLITVTWLGTDGVTGGGDDQTFTTTTGADGIWTISNLPPGNFTVQAAPPAAYDTLTDSLDNAALSATNPVAVTAVSGQTRSDIDFGFRGTATLGDRIWLDADNNGVQDPGEPGIGNVTVTLAYTGPNGETATFTTVTDASGNYAFANLPAGNYTVTVDTATLPANVTQTFDADGTATANTSATTLTTGQNRIDQDFGYRGQASLGDTVFYDVDGDGVQGNSAATGFEPGIAGVTVTATFAGRDGDLATTADNLTFTTVTDANGRYLFTGIPGGNSVGTNPNYRVTVTQPTGYAVPSADPDGLATANTAVLQLGAAENNTAQDFGYRGPATQGLGNFVWDDTNGNGVQDTGEPGIVGATVELLDAAGVVLDRTTTGTGGIYSFPNLADSATFGQYRVRFTAPTGFVFTTQSSPQSTTANDSNADATTGVTGLVTLAANTTDNSIDAGFYRPVTIGDTVFYDLDGNGTQNAPNEGGLAGVTVNLYSAGTDGVLDPADLVTPVATAITDANGNYTFANRQPGLYRVVVDTNTLPSGVTQATTPTSQDSTTTSGNNDLARDFGFRGVGAIGDRVFLDLNNDGSYTPNEGLVGVTVRLVGDLNGDGVNETLTTTTGPDGFYQFANLRTSAAGTPYTVSIDPATLPPTVTNTVDPDGGNNSTANLSLTNAAPSNQAQDFGYRGVLSLGDRVWIDANGDGVQGPVASEPGLPGVTLQITYAGPGGVFGDGDDIVSTTTTGSDGVYNFTGLPPGNYRVDVVTSTLPTNVLQTYDLNGALDNSATRTLAVGQNATDVDFGYRGTASVGDTVWLDRNADGIRQAGEGGIPGATVTLQTAGADGILGNADDVRYTTTTDANGNYLFPSVAVFNNASPSRTTVTNLPAGLTQVSDPDGTLDNTSAFALGNNEFQSNQDYGYQGNGSISGTVYRDDNNDGTPQNTEPRIAGVTLTLTGTDIFGNTVNLTTTTDNNGNYAFNLLTPGTYAVAETQPTGYSDGIDTPGSLGGNATANDVLAGIPLAVGQNGTGYNFGERGTTLSGYVFRDDARDGARTGDPGIAGVQVQVFSAGADNNLGTPDDVLVGTTTTDGNGFYGFGNLIVPGPYRIVETQPAGYGNSPGTPAIFRDVVLPANGLTEQNFGEILGTISGTVYADVNSNNTLDAGDGRIANVTVTLTGNDVNGNAVFATAVTDTNGNYTFTNLLQSDANGYRLVETQPTPPYTPGAANVGTINAGTVGVAVSDGNTIAGVVLPAGQDGINYNFGELLTPNTTFLAGSVYLDANRDGSRQSGETGIGGVTITLLDQAGTVVATTTTANDGTYLFQGLTAGSNYTILETQPNTLGDSPAGPARSIAVTNLPATGLGNQNFGETLGSISGTVYFDANNNGVQDPGEPGIAGAAVSLFGTNVNGGDIPPSILLTDANGNYTFGNLQAGTYTLSEQTPNPYTDGTDSVGSAGGVVGNDIVTQLPLSGGQIATAYNFGEIGVPVSGNVFYDRTRDGIQDSSETTIPGVTIQLVDANGNVVATTTTDGSGNYRFPNVAPGNYTLRELQPVGYGDPTTGPFSPNTRPITVAGTPISGQNFADTLSTLSGFVYVDADNNGIFDAGENPIPNTPIQLTGTDLAGNAITRLGFTDATGRYLFTDLPAGTYSITETQPPPYLDGRDTPGIPGGGNTGVNDTISAIPLGAGVDFANYNFGELQPASTFISGSVYIDRNNDGVRTTADGALAGVTVTLTNTATGATTTTTTDANGNYLFDNLTPGTTYTVTETQPVDYANGLENPTNTVTLTNLPAAGRTGVNFGEVAARLSGNVYFDRDNSGTLNAGDTPIAGVTMTLTGTSNSGTAVNRTTTTDANGFYQFLDLPAGTYSVAETQPAGYAQGVNSPGTQNGTVNGDAITAITLPAGATSANNLFGERAATVSGRVFNDINRNGIPSTGSGIAGVPVQLVDAVGVVVGTTTTAPDGTYSFVNVLPGNYTIVETQPAVFGNSPVGPATVRNVTVPAAGITDQNFGEILARLSGTVFVDFNNDGIQNPGETGIPNTAVSISGRDVLGNLIPPSIVLTDANGNYVFTELRAGSYTVSEAQPAAYGDGIDSQGSVGGIVTNDLISNVPLSAGVTATGYNFAEVGGVIGGFVFEDTNNDGLQSPIESGIPGVIITLTGTSVDGTPINAIASTDQNGFFEFRNLPAGTYTLTEEQPAGYLDGTDTVSLVGGGTQGQDPVGNDRVTAITLPPGGIANDYIFGEIRPSSITGSVYVDQNRNRTRDPFETGIGGVTVTVTGIDDRGNAVNLTQTTGPSGAYSFLNLRPGTYTIRESQPAGYSQSGNELGNAGGVLAPVDQIQTIVLAPDQSGAGYNFGEVLQPAVVPPITVPPGTGPAFPRPTKRAFLGSSPTGGSVQTLPNFAQLRPADPLAASNLLATGDGPGGQNLRVLDITTGKERINTTPFPTSTGGLRTAVGDVTGDSVQDVVVATGPGSDSTVKIYNGNTGALQSQFLAFEPAWRGGVFLATGDFNNDGREDIVVSRDAGGTAQVKIFSGADTSVVIADFNALNDPNFTGGVRVAVGDVNKDGRVDLVASSGPGGTPRVLVWNGTTLVPNGVPTQLFGEFLAFPNSFTGGVFVAVGDTNGDGYGDIIVSKDSGSTPQVKVLDARQVVLNNQFVYSADFLAFDPAFTGGVRVAAIDTNNDGISEIVAGSGPGQLELVRFYTGTGVLLDSYSANYQGNKGGVFVGA